jgi:hypothetical protein
LLDWTLNPMAALFFAVEDSDQWSERSMKCGCGSEDCTPVVWATPGHRYRIRDCPFGDFEKLECLDNKGPYFIIPDHDESRAAVQGSIVSVWSDPLTDFSFLPGLDSLWRIRLRDRESSRHVLWLLHCLGINRETLFPDLDGLGRYLSWKHRLVHEKDYRQSGRPLPRTVEQGV